MNLKIKIKGRLNALIKKTQWYNESVFKGCIKFWNLNTFDLEIVNLGSSASFYAFDYTDSGKKAANLALTSQYLLADYEILRNYSSFIRKDATVILGTCLFSLDGYDVTYFDDRYYTFLSPPSIWNFSPQRLHSILSVKNNPIQYYPLFSFIADVRNLVYRKKQRKWTDEMLEKDASRWLYDCWAKQFSIDDFSLPLSIRNADLARQAVQIVVKIKELCDQKGFKLVLVQPPVSRQLKVKLTTELRKNYVYLFRDCELLKDCKYLDFLDDADFENSEYFQNAYFLNQRGAKLFTNKVLTILDL